MASWCPMKTSPTTTSLVFRPLTLLGCAVFMLMSSAMGCSSGDDAAAEDTGPVCGNGRIEAGEVCDGADIGAALCTDSGFDGGVVGCSADCAAVDMSACEYYDVDGDGLTSDVEANLGTDPNNPDTDSDGFSDADEQTAGTDPLTLNSWPISSQTWPNRLDELNAAGVTGEGWDVGDIARNVKLTDQYGNLLELYQLYGYNIMLSVGARWCGPCNEAASTSQDLWAEYADKGIIFVEILLDGNTPGKAATQSDIDYWTNKYDMLFPVGFLAGASSLAAKVSALPTFVFIDRDMRITKWDEGFGGDSALSNQLDKME